MKGAVGMSKNREIASFIIAAALIAAPASAAVFTGQGPNEAARMTVTERFAAHDPASAKRLDFVELTDFLSMTVVYAGESTRRLGKGKKRVWIDSKIAHGNDLPPRYENNRVVLGGFTKDHRLFLAQFRAGLEALAADLPLSALNRNEQLAFWLNLYNVHALEIVAEHYPATTTTELRPKPGKKRKGAWHEKTLTVAGVPLSLVDIETQILFPIWQDPRVLYGLWQGAVGGPRLPLRAYEGGSVHRMLEANAFEFVNSNRGMRPKGEKLEVSWLYGWGSDLFQNDDALFDHIVRYARPPFSEGLGGATDIKIDLYDPHPADLSGGSHHEGQWNHTAAFVFGLDSSTPSGRANGTLLGNFAMRSDTSRLSLPPLTVELLSNIQRFNSMDNRGRVTIEDCERGEPDCVLVDDGGDARPSSQP